MDMRYTLLLCLVRILCELDDEDLVDTKNDLNCFLFYSMFPQLRVGLMYPGEHRDNTK